MAGISRNPKFCYVSHQNNKGKIQPFLPDQFCTVPNVTLPLEIPFAYYL